MKKVYAIRSTQKGVHYYLSSYRVNLRTGESEVTFDRDEARARTWPNRFELYLYRSKFPEIGGRVVRIVRGEHV